MAPEPVFVEEPIGMGGVVPPLAPEERRRLAALGITEDDVLRDPGLRFADVFADDPDFLPLIKDIFKASRGREMPE